MKRIKIMLTALSIMAIVGGALAFKAQKFVPYCYYSSTQSHNGLGGDYCNYNSVGNRILGAIGGSNFATMAIKENNQCPNTVTCTQKFLSAPEN